MTIEIPEECDDWMQEILADFSRIEERALPPETALAKVFSLEGEDRPWVILLLRELMKALFPTAALKVSPEWTVRELGGVLGQRLAVMLRTEEPEAFPQIDFDALEKMLTPAQIAEAVLVAEAIAAFSVQLRAATARALGVALWAADHSSASEFITAFAKGLSNKPRNLTPGEMGRGNTGLHWWLFFFRNQIGTGRQLDDTAKVYDLLLKLGVCRSPDGLSDEVAFNDRMRVSKIFQRLKIPFARRPGRPRRKPIIEDKKY